MTHKPTSGKQRTADTSRRQFLAAVGASGVLVGVGGTALGQDDGTPTPEDGEGTPEDGEEPAETFVLMGNTEAWGGRAPEAIVDEENPTLELEADQTYELIWENGDGQPHNFAIQNEDGDNLQVLESIDVPEEVPGLDTEVGGDGTPTPEGEDGGGQEEGTPTPTPEDGEEGTPEDGEEDLMDVTETIQEEGERQAVRFTASEEMATYICEIHPNTMVGDISLGDGGDGEGTPTPTPEE